MHKNARGTPPPLSNRDFSEDDSLQELKRDRLRQKSVSDPSFRVEDTRRLIELARELHSAAQVLIAMRKQSSPPKSTPSKQTTRAQKVDPRNSIEIPIELLSRSLPEQVLERSELSIVEIVDEVKRLLSQEIDRHIEHARIRRQRKVINTPLNPSEKLRVAAATYEARRIRSFMEGLGVGQREFARDLSTGSSNVSRWLKGRPPTADFLQKMAELGRIRGVEFKPFEDDEESN